MFIGNNTIHILQYIAIHNCIENIDILFSAHDRFLEYLHHSKTMESQII
jgi:hypothetical protein